MRNQSFLAAAMIGLCGLALPAGQTPPPGQTEPQQPAVTFKVEVNYVEIDAVVTDAAGKFVPGLTKDDFQVLEEGTPQTISTFSRVDLPVERPDPPLYRPAAIEPDVRTNRVAFNGRVFVLVLDDLQTDFRRTPRVKAAARQFVERYMGANDLAAVVMTGGANQDGQEFTSSRPLLLAAINKFAGRKLPSATLAKLDDYYAQSGLNAGAPRDTSEAERSYKARSTLSSLAGIADYLGGIRGRRKAVLWFGEGIDYDTTNPFEARDATVIRDAMRETIAAATRANATFYAIDPRGLGAGLDESINIASLPDDPTLNLGVMSIQDEVRRAHDSLLMLSEETGGFATVNRNSMTEAFERIVQENSSYYVMGYYATNEKRDGRFRNIQVRTTRPGLTVRARKGYVAPKGRPAKETAPAGVEAKMPAAVRDALNSPIPSSGVTMAMFAAPFSGPGSKSALALTFEIDPGALRFVEKNGTFNEDLELFVMAFDAKGKLQDGGHDLAPLRLSAPSHAVVSRNGLRLTHRLFLPPGRYQIRAAARDGNGGAIGTVRQDLDVPDFSKSPLQMSAITLASASASRILTANPDPLFKDVLAGPPTAARDFPTSDTLSLFAEVYDNQTTPHRVALKTSILADNGKTVFTASDERASSELQGKKGGYGYTLRIPLADIPAGRYVLRVEARTLLSNGAGAVRELEFRIR